MDVTIQNNTKQEAVANMNKNLCSMIVNYQSKLMEEAIDVIVDVVQEIVDVHDSDKEKVYIDLETVGQS